MLGEAEFQSVLSAAKVSADWAWASIYRGYAPAVLRYLRGHGSAEPEDLLGEVFVQIVRGIDSFDGSENAFRSWVFMIARNRLVDEWRKKGRDRTDIISVDEMVAVVGVVDTEAEVMRRFSDTAVAEVLACLTQEQRDVLYLRLFADLTIEQIAQALGKRSGAIKALQARALARIQREISRKAVTL